MDLYRSIGRMNAKEDGLRRDRGRGVAANGSSLGISRETGS